MDKIINVMAKEIRTKEDMLVWRLGQMAEENAELELRLNRLVDEYNCTVDALSELRKREKEGSEKEKPDEMRETSTKTTLGEMFQMRDLCDKLERENMELKRFEKAIHGFVKDKNIYMKKGTYCVYRQSVCAVCSTACLECDSCLGVIEGCGVVCAKRLSTWKTEENIRPNLNGKESENG